MTFTWAEQDSAVTTLARGIPGTYWHFPSMLAAANQMSFSQDRLAAIPVNSTGSVLADQIICEVTTAGAAGAVIRFGLYSDVNGIPTNLITDFGTVTGDTIAVKTLSISYTFSGKVWLAFVGQIAAGTACYGALDSSQIGIPQTVWQPTGTSCVGSLTVVSGALPATFGPIRSDNTGRRTLLCAIRTA